MIAEKEIFVGDSVRYLMLCQGVNNTDVYRLLNDDGDVDFTRSKTDGYPKKYLFQGYKDDKDITITYALFDSTAEVIAFEYGSNLCETQQSNANKSVVALPDNEVITIIESKEIRILENASCQLKCLGISEDEIRSFHMNATTDTEKSEPRLQPNPYYWLTGKIGMNTYSVKYIIGDHRTRISQVISENQNCKCD